MKHHTLQLSSRLPAAAVAIAALAVLFSGGLQAQFGTALSLEKTTFLAYEAITATVTIVNRSGADVIMGGNQRGNWLSFEITDSNGRTITPAVAAQDDTFVFKAGSTIARKIRVSDLFALGDLGTYGITASVFHPPTQQYYASNRVRFNVTDAKPFKELPIGVPEGYPNAGRVHVYALIVFRDVDRAFLYFRLIDQRSKSPVLTYQLGPVTVANDPQVAIDRENKLHVMFQATPQIFAHTIIKPDGNLQKREYFKDVQGNRPVLVANASNEFFVQGGELYDPTAPDAGKPKAKGVSERPPGL